METKLPVKDVKYQLSLCYIIKNSMKERSDN